MIAPLKFDEILKVLVDHGVEFILVALYPTPGRDRNGERGHQRAGYYSKLAL
jgi:hypothetical protein